MKNINLIKILICLLVTCSTSCKKFIDRSPISNYNSKSFYKTQSDFQLATNGMYDNLRVIGFWKTIFLESRSDNTKSKQIGSENQTFALLSSFTETPSIPQIIDLWSGYWRVINQSNSIINNIDAGTFDNESLRNLIKGEAYFLRGFAYLELGWEWGGMPIVDHEVTPEELAGIKRSSQSETLAFAKENLSKAIELLPESWPNQYLGKATKYTAEGYLARLYMFNQDFTNAVPLLQDIIQSGKYQLAENYADIFSESFDNSPEHVFQVQFVSGRGKGMYLPYYYFGQYVHEFFPNGSGPGIFVSEDLYDSYESGDIRRDFSIAKDLFSVQGIFNTIDKFSIKFAHGNTNANFGDNGLNLPLLRFTDIKLMYAEALNETGSGFSSVQSIIDEIRQRAQLAPVDMSAFSKDQIRDAILKERRVEFAFEGIRWFDLVRTNKVLSTMNTFLARADEGSSAFSMKDFQAIFPIPQSEINLNPDPQYMPQNPGY